MTEDRYHTCAGAEFLAQRIQAYWLERGYNVRCEIVSAGFHGAIRAARFDVRSDMVNGLPANYCGPRTVAVAVQQRRGA